MADYMAGNRINMTLELKLNWKVLLCRLYIRDKYILLLHTGWPRLNITLTLRQHLLLIELFLREILNALVEDAVEPVGVVGDVGVPGTRHAGRIVLMMIGLMILILMMIRIMKIILMMMMIIIMIIIVLMMMMRLDYAQSVSHCHC